MRPPLLLTMIAVASGVGAILLWAVDIPLGVPTEWTWPRIPFSIESVAGLLQLTPAALLYLVWVGWASKSIATGSNRKTASSLIGLTVAGFAWLTAVQSAVPGIAGLSKSPFVLYYPRSSGYFWQARYEVTSPRQFLADYDELMAERDYLHIGTHPPGLTLLFCAILHTLEGSPALTRALLATQPPAVDDAAQTIRNQSRQTPHPFTQTDQASLWLWTLLVQASAVLVVVPLFLILAVRVDRMTAFHAAAMWPLVPAIAVFLPKSDVLFPFLSLFAAWLWWAGWRHRSPAACTAAGVTLFAGMSCSLALLPTAALIALWTLLDAWLAWRRNPESLKPRRATLCVGCAAAGFLAPVLILWPCCDLNLFTIWRWNFQNHALFYDHNVRTFWKWLLVNPIELILAAGAPLAVLAAAGVIHSLRARRHLPFVVALMGIWGLLWLSGKNMGEAARLWIVLMPWLAVAAGLLGQAGASPDQPQPLPRRFWLAALTIQLIVSTITVTRIDGFHFDQLRDAASIEDQTAFSGMLTRSPSESSMSSAISQRSRPRFFAMYSAASADAINCEAVLPC